MAVGEPTTRHAPTARGGPFLEALRAPTPLRAVELRPPPARLSGDDSRDAWIDLDRGVRRLLQRERFVLFTDDAVGDREEESLRVLSDGLGGEADLSRVVPFLTCKHSLEYCRLFGRRAGAEGLGGVTVTGGDREVGVPRCLPRSRDLRAELRPRVPGLPLGAWVNPYRDPTGQVELLQDPEHQADYFLTQVVSHHDMEPVDRFLEEARRRDLTLPGLFGVFFYRSANPETLERLADFMPVPADALTAEFEAGAAAEEICARTLRALAERGVHKVYVSNLKIVEAARRLDAVEDLLE
ncbi:MAG: hypothetical protein EA351_03835 [Gemmatimonadales bacterium]|nr:MAG: hypothetical protein EA351_03835 [Gemmatimonadales bacterium]